MDFKDKRVRYTAIALAVILVVIGWRIYANVSKNREKARLSSQVRAVTVTIGQAKRQTIKPVVKLSGTLDPVWQADVATKAAARINKVYVDVGAKVRAGDVLAELDTGELGGAAAAAEGSVYDARAALSSAETHLARCEKLFAQEAISQMELDNARYARDMAAGKLNAAEGTYANAASRLSGATVTAPRDGTIVKRYYQEGFYAKDDKPIFNIADTSSLIVKIDVPEGQIGYVDNTTQVSVRVPALENRELSGTITKLAEVADLPARTFAAEVSVDNSSGFLKGGLFANVYLKTKEKANVLTLPQQAIVMREDQRTVYVVGDDSRVIRRVVDTGYIGDGLVEILGGVTEKDRVIMKGQNRVKEGSLVQDEAAAKDGKEK